MRDDPVVWKRAQAKLVIVAAWSVMHGASDLSATVARATFAEQFNAGAISIPEDLRAVIPCVSARSLRRWSAELKRAGADSLTGKYGNRKGTGTIDSNAELREFIVGLIADKPHIRASHVGRALKARFGDARLPSQRNLERWIARWKQDNRQLHSHLSNPDQWRNRSKVAFGSTSEGITRLNRVWELDSTPADVMLQGGRHAVVGVIDVFTRRAKVLVSKTSKSTAIAALMRRAILDWGVPEAIKTDNGKDYVSGHILAVTMRLEIEHVTCPPFTPEAKPHIERFFGTLTRGLFERLPGFIGHDVSERKGIRARQSAAQDEGEPIQFDMTPDDLQQACDRWCEAEYGREPHGGLGGKSPFQVASEWSGPLRRVPDARALDVLLERSQQRVVRKDGIWIERRNYVAPEIAPLIGSRVTVGIDETDAGHIHVYQRGRFLCVAECPELTGTPLVEIAARAKAVQQEFMREARKGAKQAARNAQVANVHMEIADHAEREAARVVALPRRGEPYITPALEEAAKAAAAKPTGESARDWSEEAEAKELARLRKYDAAGEWALKTGLIKPRKDAVNG